MAGFWQQLKALLRRNFLLKKRNRIQLFQEIFFPIYFVAILVTIRLVWNPSPIPAAKFPALNVNDTRFGQPFSSSKTILVVPDDPQIKTWMQDVVSQLPGPPKVSFFPSKEAAESRYRDNHEDVAAGVIFNTTDHYSYAIRVDYDDVPSTANGIDRPAGACQRDNGTTQNRRCNANKYLTSGFAQLQLALDNVLMKSLGLTSLDPTSRHVKVQFMDIQKYLPDSNIVQSMSSIYFVMSFAFLATYLSVNIVAEKEKKIKDGMLMMGLRGSAFWLSWAIIYFVIIMISTAIMVGILGGSRFIDKSNVIILYIAFLLYGASFIALAFMITPFFNKAKVAGAVTGFSTIIISCLYLAVSQTRDAYSYDANVPAAVQWFMCLLSPIAFATFIDQGLYLDIRMNGFGFDDSMTFGKFPLYAPILMLAVDTVLYAILTIYFDHVIPGEYGVRYHPLYFLKRSYWCKSNLPAETSMLLDSHLQRGLSQMVDVEPVPRNLEGKVAMRISSLTKTFKADGKVNTAVDGFCLDVYESQITCLLGHNGAGKSTLLNMLTGVLPPTSGSATIMGLDITDSTDLELIRAKCGICPQHNILYDNLSCMEHLQIFANIKGVPGHLVNSVAEAALKDVDLESQAHTYARDLSGGQKRKLSVGIALIGDPKLIFLDEPTAGMDPYSRRHLWSLLTQRKHGRVVLLTTHFMDEADILADRKAFIRKGKLRCCGSSLFLKNKFGIGYHLTMVVSPDCRVDKVTSLLKSVIPDVEHQRSHGKEVSYTVPLKDVSEFSTLFGELDEKAESFGIKSYGVSMTTLEEVFLKLEADEVGDEVEVDNGDINHAFSANPDNDSIDMESPLPTDQVPDKPSVYGHSLSWQRFMALFKIRFLLMFRNYRGVFFQVVLPVVLVAIGLTIAKIGESSPAGDPTMYSFSPDNYVERASSVPPSNITLPPLLVFDAVKNVDSGDVIEDWRTQWMVENYTAGSRNTSAIAPHFMGTQINSLAGKVLMDFVAIYNETAVHAIPTAINMVTQSMLSFSNITTRIQASVLSWSQRKGLEFNNGAYMSAMLIGMAFMFVIPGFASEVVQDREKKLRGQLRISGVNFNIYWGSIYVSDLLVYMIPAIAIIIIIFAMQVPGLTNGGAVGALIMLFMTNIPFNVVMGLVLSFVFDKSETCTAYLPLLLLFAALIPYMAVALVDMITESNVTIVLHYAFCILFPPYLTSGGFYFISRVHMVAVNKGEADSVTAGDYFDFSNHILITILMPIVHFIWMYWLLRVLDVRATGGEIKEAFPCAAQSIDAAPSINTDTIQDEDEDVIAERARIENLYTQDDREPVAYTSQLRKVFVKRTKSSRPCRPGLNKMKVAVRNLSIGVDRGEVLGLLGPNGAGKSTAMNLMIAETGPTCGKVVVSGHNVRSNMLSVLESLGYCPQHDALWDTITLEEHIKCFAAIKGIDIRQINEVADYYVKSLKLQEHRKKHSKNLSGGTKRKLSYVMSILGSPHLVLMDEPSTGMDPQSKRFLWDTISSSFNGTDRGAILTTHYMEEADALCGRVGIMVNGQLQCIGSTQHLKGKYGSGYILEVKLGYHEASNVEVLMDNLESHLKTLFPGMEITERFMERAQYAIPKMDVKSLGKTFASLESCKNTHKLEEYSFSQSSLEQVFLYFAKQQMEEGADDSQTNRPALTSQLSRMSRSEDSRL